MAPNFFYFLHFFFANRMSALPPKADMCGALVHICFGPKADIYWSRMGRKDHDASRANRFFCRSINSLKRRRNWASRMSSISSEPLRISASNWSLSNLQSLSSRSDINLSTTSTSATRVVGPSLVLNVGIGVQCPSGCDALLQVPRPTA